MLKPSDADILAIARLFPEGDKGCVTPFLRAVQSKYQWLPPAALDTACDHFQVSYPRVYEEAALSPEFCLEPRGEHVIAVCRGLACSEAHGSDVLNDWERALGIREGETTADGRFSLCSQNCFGRCAIGPNVKMDERFVSGQKAGDAVLHLKTFQ